MPDVGTPETGFNTPLTPAERTAFATWKNKYAPNDSGADYDLRGAFKAGVKPDPETGHWPDTFKKPNHPTFSVESQYAKYAPHRAGTWGGENRDVYQPAASQLVKPNEEQWQSDFRRFVGVDPNDIGLKSKEDTSAYLRGLSTSKSVFGVK